MHQVSKVINKMRVEVKWVEADLLTAAFESTVLDYGPGILG